MTILEYEARIYKLVGYATSIMTTMYERVWCFVWDLDSLSTCLHRVWFIKVGLLLRFIIMITLCRRYIMRPIR